MDDSYTMGCYLYDDKELSILPPAILAYMKMEIYADYNYKFSTESWNKTFSDTMIEYEAKYSSVENSLTEIDRYNIKWINQKLHSVNSKKLAYSK